jgi:hypothetical protein
MKKGRKQHKYEEFGKIMEVMNKSPHRFITFAQARRIVRHKPSVWSYCGVCNHSRWLCYTCEMNRKRNEF